MKILIKILLILTMILFSASKAYAGDLTWRLIHNDQDALIIGKVTSYSNNTMQVDVVKTIVSSAGKTDHKQISPNTVRINDVRGYAYFYDDKGKPLLSPKKGDCILASIDKTFNGFRIANGFYKVDKTYYKSLTVLANRITIEENDYIDSDIAAINAFVNSGGKVNDFYYDGSTVYSKPNKKLIFSAEKRDIFSSYKFVKTPYLSPLSSQTIDNLDGQMKNSKCIIASDKFTITIGSRLIEIKSPKYVRELIQKTSVDWNKINKFIGNCIYQYTVYDKSLKKTNWRFYVREEKCWVSSYNDNTVDKSPIVMNLYEFNK